jgi:asparagine N-glycosylation enzyme membrane subunit Stt3
MRNSTKEKVGNVLRFIAAIFVIFSMTVQGLAQSWLWFLTLVIFLVAWIILERYLEEIDHRKFWQDIAKRQSVRQREN